MKAFNWKLGLWMMGALFALLSPLAPAARAGQEIFLSVSPDTRYRVVVHQEILRRVDDQIFFRYPIEVVDVRRHTHFKIQTGSAPFIQETASGTFGVDWQLIRFAWDTKSQEFFFQLQVIEGLWRTYAVNIPRETSTDITPLLEAGIQDQFDKDHPGCGTPETRFVQWVKPHLALFKLVSTCGKDKPIPNSKFSELSYQALFDTQKGKVVSDCLNCADPKALKQFNRYWLSTQVTPTPTPDETPGAE